MLNIFERRRAWLADKLGSIAIEALGNLELWDRSMTNRSEFRNCYEQEAARLRALSRNRKRANFKSTAFDTSRGTRIAR